MTATTPVMPAIVRACTQDLRRPITFLTEQVAQVIAVKVFQRLEAGDTRCLMVDTVVTDILDDEAERVAANGGIWHTPDVREIGAVVDAIVARLATVGVTIR